MAYNFTLNTHNAEYFVSLKYELIQVLLDCIRPIGTDTRYLSENVSR